MTDTPEERLRAKFDAFPTAHGPLLVPLSEALAACRAARVDEAAKERARITRDDEEEACLRWTCETCGWNVVIPMPGYAGDGHYHYGAPENTPCGPLVARREGFIRARPGATVDDLIERGSGVPEGDDPTASA